MVKLGAPPSVEELQRIGPQLRVVDERTLLWRIYFRAARHPVVWNAFRRYGPVTSGRFDHHVLPARMQDRAVLYVATEVATCVAEVFQEQRVVDRSRSAPWLAGFRVREPVTLLDLTGVWPTRAGASMAIGTGPRSRAQAWSRQLYDAFPEIHGLLYGSSMHANRPSIVLYERAAAAIPASPAFNAALSDPGLAAPLHLIAEHLGYLLR